MSVSRGRVGASLCELPNACSSNGCEPQDEELLAHLSSGIGAFPRRSEGTDGGQSSENARFCRCLRGLANEKSSARRLETALIGATDLESAV